MLCSRRLFLNVTNPQCRQSLLGIAPCGIAVDCADLGRRAADAGLGNAYKALDQSNTIFQPSLM